MNLIDTYELEKDITTVLSKDLTGSAAKKEYSLLAETALASEIQRQALDQAISDVLEPEKAEEVMDYATNLIEEYTWRNTTEEMKEQLKERNCVTPLVIMKSTENAVQYLEDGYPIYAIYETGECDLMESDTQIKQAEKEGCIFGTSQYAIDDVMEYILYHQDNEQ